jgi:cytochrome c oxidase assembly protein subunit 15
MVLLLAALGIGGAAAGRWTDRGVRGGAIAGLLASVVNLLILGSLLSGDEPNRIVPSAMWWVPGSLIVGAVLGGVGGWIGRLTRRHAAAPANWVGAFAVVGAVATFFLVIAGGLVTSYEAGLAVVDWPNSYGYNMFLYPLSKMTGGIYYEHAHRLFGSLVGLATLVLAGLVFSSKRHRFARPLAVAATVAVVVQGILGGLRVTGRFTMSASPEMTAPNLTLAVVHGVAGQVFFALMVALAVVLSTAWATPGTISRTRIPGMGVRTLSSLLVAMIVLQVFLGAVLRHTAAWLMLHIILAVVVFTVAIACGTVVLGEFQELRILRRTAMFLIVGIIVQMVLGVGALLVTRSPAARPGLDVLEVAVATAHQAAGALLLACTVLIALWTRRVASPSLFAAPTDAMKPAPSPGG